MEIRLRTRSPLARMIFAMSIVSLSLRAAFKLFAVHSGAYQQIFGIIFVVAFLLSVFMMAREKDLVLNCDSSARINQYAAMKPIRDYIEFAMIFAIADLSMVIVPRESSHIALALFFISMVYAVFYNSYDLYFEIKARKLLTT